MHFKNYIYLQAKTRMSGMLDYSLFCIHLLSMCYDLIHGFREISSFRPGEAEAFVLLLPEVQRPQLKCPFRVPFFYIVFLGLLVEKWALARRLLKVSCSFQIKTNHFKRYLGQR